MESPFKRTSHLLPQQDKFCFYSLPTLWAYLTETLFVCGNLFRRRNVIYIILYLFRLKN